MKEKEVPNAWVDAAMTGAAPGCRDDARFYLANAYELIRDDLLWEAVKSDVYVTCACGRSWEANADRGPDEGHGRTNCPSSQDAMLVINWVVIHLSEWSLTPLASWGVGTGRRWQIGGWMPEGQRMNDPRLHPLYAKDARLGEVDLPGRMKHFQHPGDKKLDVEIQGVGGPRLWFAVRWDMSPPM